MKRLIAALCLMAFAVAVAVTSNIVANKLVDDVIKSAEQVKKDGRMSLEEFECMEKKWKKTRDLIVLFVPHDNVDRISECLATIKTHLNGEDENMSEYIKTEVARLLFLLRHVKESEELTIHNLL